MPLPSQFPNGPVPRLKMHRARRAARTGKVGSVRMRERSSFGRAQRGERGRLRHFGKVAQTARSVEAERRRRSCFESSLVINGRSRSMGGGWTRLIRTKRTDAKGGPTQRRPTNRNGLSTDAADADVIPRNLVLYLERLLRDSVLGGGEEKRAD